MSDINIRAILMKELTWGDHNIAKQAMHELENFEKDKERLESLLLILDKYHSNVRIYGRDSLDRAIAEEAIENDKLDEFVVNRIWKRIRDKSDESKK